MSLTEWVVVYADRRVPSTLRNDPVLYGECLGGALYWNDFQHLARRHGFTDPRLVEDRPIVVTDPVLAALTQGIGFHSATYRLFELDGLEPDCEDYGQAVIYRGGIAGHEQRFTLDKHHAIEAGRVFPVCGNTWRMLHDSRFARHFEFIGDFSRHFGLCGGGLRLLALLQRPTRGGDQGTQWLEGRIHDPKIRGRGSARYRSPS